MEQLKRLAKNVTLFKDLSEQELEPILKIAKRREFPDKQMIFIHDTPITDVYIVESGKVKVFRNDLSGKEQIIRVMQRGDLFPHVGFFRDENYPAHSQAIEDTVLYSISIKQFEDVLLMNPKISIKLLRLLGSLIVDSQQRLEEMALRNTNERILLLLLRLSKSHGTKQPDGSFKLNTRFTNSDLANMIGTSRESVNRMISQLRKDYKVKFIEGYYYIFPEEIMSEI